MNDEVPDFQSDIPAHLLTNASPQDKYIMENISILGQKSNWLTQTQKKQSENLEELKTEIGEVKHELSEVRVQTTKTNGRVSTLEAEGKNTIEIVSVYNKVKGFASNKLFLMAGAFSFVVFFAYVAPWIEANGKSIILAIFSAFFGG